MNQPISTGADWTFELITRYDQEIAQIAKNEFKLDTYRNQIEIIHSEQMLDAYASVGLPLSYPHWSYGKAFLANEQSYRKGMQGLAYEIVINSDPCIAYLMEENTMTMQALVVAHASYGHNSFFKGNYLFRQWTSADSILDYMLFARDYVMKCEERFGIAAVEQVLDAAHALREYGIDRYRRPQPLSLDRELARQQEREEHAAKQFDDIWRTLPVKEAAKRDLNHDVFPPEPQENILYFIEKYSPKLAGWQRELIRIVRKLAQYFYPQGLTKVMNEGWATFWHYTLLNRLHDKGLVTDGFMLEFLHSHVGVVGQRGFDERGYHGINPYALGFAMFQDIKRIAENPTDEDRFWFPEIAGQDWLKVLDFAMRNFKDESFISQYLSPKVIRDQHLFGVADYERKQYLRIDSIHNEEGYRRIRQLLSQQYNRDSLLPDIQVIRYEKDTDRSLVLRHSEHRGRPLSTDHTEVLKHLVQLWGFPVRLETVDETGKEKYFQEMRP